MKVVKDQGMYKAARITGPSHNLLCIEFQNIRADALVFEILGPKNSKFEAAKQEIIEAIQNSIEITNQRLGTHLLARRIQVMADDTIDIEAYKILAEVIMEAAKEDMKSQTLS